VLHSRDALGQSRQLQINSSFSKAMGSGGSGTCWEIDLEGFFSASFLSDDLAGKRLSGFVFRKLLFRYEKKPKSVVSNISNAVQPANAQTDLLIFLPTSRDLKKQKLFTKWAIHLYF